MPPQYSQTPPLPHGVTPPGSHLPRQRSFLIPFVIFILLTVIFFSLFIWAYLGMLDYKKNVDPKISAAVKSAVQEESSRKDNEFIEKEKSPLKVFNGPDTFGGITFSYPKTWSSYVINNEKSGVNVDGYFHPDTVPDIAGKTAYALRVRVLDKTYDQHLKSLEGKVRQNKITLVAYTPLKQKGVLGSRLDGEVNVGQKDHMIILPLRDKTIEISTESDQFNADFEKIILETLSFTP